MIKIQAEGRRLKVRIALAFASVFSLLLLSTAFALQKNVASQNICAEMISKTDGSIVTTGTTTIYITGDGTQSGGTTTATHKGQGLWCYSPAQAETNYSHVAYTFINPSAVYTSVQTYPGENASSDQAVQILSRVTNVGVSQRVVSSLNDMIQAQSGNNWLEVEVWVTDADGNKFDPADITNPNGGARSYNGIGAEFEDQSGNRVVMYDDNHNPLNSCTFCHHTAQANQPQILPRISAGYYRFWTNATAYNNLLPIGQLRMNTGYFDISQPTATYGSTHISDTTPTTSHKEVSFKALVQEAVGYQSVIDQVVASEGNITNILGTPANTTLAGDIAAIFDQSMASHVTQSSVGAKINNAGSSTYILPAMQGSVYTAVATQNQTLAIVRKDSPQVTFNLGSNYTGWTATFGAKVSSSSTYTTYAVGPVTATWTNAATGQGYFKLESTDTNIAEGNYYGELVLTNGTQRMTAIKFTLRIVSHVIN